LIYKEFYIIFILFYNILIDNDIIYTYLSDIDINRQVVIFKLTRYKIFISILKSIKLVSILITLIFKTIYYKSFRIKKTRVFIIKITIIDLKINVNISI
jgi:hypothetical protein